MWVVVPICGQSHESLPLLMALLISSKMWRRRRLIKEMNSFGRVAKTPESGLNIYSLLWSCRHPVPAPSLLCLSTLYLCAPEPVLNYQLDATDCFRCRFLILLHHFYFYLSSYLLKYLCFCPCTSAAATPESPSGVSYKASSWQIRYFGTSLQPSCVVFNTAGLICQVDQSLIPQNKPGTKLRVKYLSCYRTDCAEDKPCHFPDLPLNSFLLLAASVSLLIGRSWH